MEVLLHASLDADNLSDASSRPAVFQTAYGELHYLRGLAVPPTAILPNPQNPRVADSDHAAQSNYTGRNVGISESRTNDGKTAHITLHSESLEAIPAVLAEASMRTKEANSTITEAVALSGTSGMEHVETTIVKLVIAEREVVQKHKGRRKRLLIPEQVEYFLMVHDGNSRIVAALHLSSASGPTTLTEWEEFFNELLTHAPRRKYKVIDKDGNVTGEVWARVPILRSSKSISDEAKRRIAETRQHPHVQKLEGKRYRFDEDRWNETQLVATQSIHADVIFAFEPDEDGGPSAYYSAVVERAITKHAQEPHSPTSTAITAFKTALHNADGVISQGRRAIAAGLRSASIAGETVSIEEILEAEFPNNPSNGMRLLKGVALGVQFLSTNEGRAHLRRTAGTSRLQTASFHTAVVSHHLEPTREAWEKAGFAPGVDPYATLRAGRGALPFDELLGSANAPRFQVTDRSVEAIRDAAIAELNAGYALKYSPSLLELMVMAAPPLAFTGILRQSGGGTVATPGQLKKYGAWNLHDVGASGKVPVNAKPASVMSGLATSEAGIRLMAQACVAFEQATQASPTAPDIEVSNPADDSSASLTPARLLCIALPDAVKGKVAEAHGQNGNEDDDNEDEVAAGELLLRHVHAFRDASESLTSNVAGALQIVEDVKVEEVATTLNEGCQVLEGFLQQAGTVLAQIGALNETMKGMVALTPPPQAVADDHDDSSEYLDLGEAV